MHGGKKRRGFLRSGYARILTGVLIVQAGLFSTLSQGDAVSIPQPLNTLPAQLGSWNLATEGVIEKEIQDVLKADDTVSRIYAKGSTGIPANLFVAYFATQRTGRAPHSPKNCLPGSGWAPSAAGIISVPVSGQPAPIQVNRYVVSRGGQKSVVLYWYQTRNRVIASEYAAKAYLVLDSIRYRRSDTALVRVVVPFEGDREERATAIAVDFVQSFFEPLRRHLPS